MAAEEAREQKARVSDLSSRFSRQFSDEPEQVEAGLKSQDGWAPSPTHESAATVDPLNSLPPFRRVPAYPGSGVIEAQVDAAAIGPAFKGYRVELMFAPRWSRTDFGAGLGEVRVFPPPARWQMPTADVVANIEQIRIAAMTIGAAAWALGLLTMFFAKPWRQQIAQVCLAGTIVVAVGWTIGPGRTWRLGELLNAVPIAIAVAGGVSVALMIVPAGHRTGTAGMRRCAGCGYDLTGNLSGVCPECGRPTARLLVERWQAQAERLCEIGSPARRDSADTGTRRDDASIAGI